jgi:hypothetical protein
VLDDFDPMGSLLALMLKPAQCQPSVPAKEEGFSVRRITGWCSMNGEGARGNGI